MIDIGKISITTASASRIREVESVELPFGKVFSDHMLITDFTEGQWRNMRIVPYGPIVVGPGTPAIHYGQCVFEGMKAYRSQDNRILLFRPLDHWKRMNRSAERMCMPLIEQSVFMEGLCELVNLDRAWVPSPSGRSLYIRPFMFSGDEYIGIRPSTNFRFMIITCPVGLYYSAPLKVRIETHYTRSIAGGVGYVKASGNYGGSIYPTKLAQDTGYNQLIWTDGKEHKYIEESGTMNVMFVLHGTLVTPALSDSILGGITRDSALTLAQRWGVKVEERKVSVQEVIEALKSGDITEAFGTGTAATIAHIQTISHEGKDYHLPPPAEGSLSLRILQELSAIRRGRKEDPFRWTHAL